MNSPRGVTFGPFPSRGSEAGGQRFGVTSWSRKAGKGVGELFLTAMLTPEPPKAGARGGLLCLLRAGLEGRSGPLGGLGRQGDTYSATADLLRWEEQQE